MIRDMVTINEEKCNGCGVCISACHEGALALVNGKARLISDSYCDGLGACLPECPTGAITIEKREAAAFELPAGHPAAGHSAPAAHESPAAPAAAPASAPKAAAAPLACGCPGSHARSLKGAVPPAARAAEPAPAPAAALPESELRQWPVQLKLVPVNAPYFQNAKLLIAADCAAYARASFHQEFMRGRITLIGCPKLDAGSYVEKLTEIFKNNDIRSIMVARMEVPCCGGLEMAVRQALMNSGRMIPWQVVTLGTDGSILQE